MRKEFPLTNKLAIKTTTKTQQKKRSQSFNSLRTTELTFRVFPIESLYKCLAFKNETKQKRGGIPYTPHSHRKLISFPKAPGFSGFPHFCLNDIPKKGATNYNKLW